VRAEEGVLDGRVGHRHLSTSTRLALNMDRVRELGTLSEGLFTGSGTRFAQMRLRGVEGQLEMYRREAVSPDLPSRSP
jgi:hypothetical protein